MLKCHFVLSATPAKKKHFPSFLESSTRIKSGLGNIDNHFKIQQSTSTEKTNKIMCQNVDQIVHDSDKTTQQEEEIVTSTPLNNMHAVSNSSFGSADDFDKHLLQTTRTKHVVNMDDIEDVDKQEIEVNTNSQNKHERIEKKTHKNEDKSKTSPKNCVKRKVQTVQPLYADSSPKSDSITDIEDSQTETNGTLPGRMTRSRDKQSTNEVYK